MCHQWRVQHTEDNSETQNTQKQMSNNAKMSHTSERRCICGVCQKDFLGCTTLEDINWLTEVRSHTLVTYAGRDFLNEVTSKYITQLTLDTDHWLAQRCLDKSSHLSAHKRNCRHEGDMACSSLSSHLYDVGEMFSNVGEMVKVQQTDNTKHQMSSKSK